MERVRLAPRARALLEPVAPVLGAAVGNVPGGPPLDVDLGPVAGFYQLDGDVLRLSDALEGPAVSHPCEPEGPTPPLDRWRRALSSILEGLALRALSEATGRPPSAEWWWAGAAVDAADVACPGLSLADADLADAIGTGDLTKHPRAGVAVMRAWRARGEDAWKRAIACARGERPDAAAWLEIGRWVLGAGATTLPAPVPKVAERDIPFELGPWRWARVAVPPHPRGGRVDVEGDVVVAEPWAVAKKPLRTMAASVSGGRLKPASGGPVGRWTVASASGFGQIFGARGLDFRFRASGALDLELADAFVGPVGGLDVAKKVGTSGVATGTWEVAGPMRLRFDRIVPNNLAVHARERRGFVLPSGEVGMGPMLQAMMDDVWTWRVDGDRLVLSGTIGGGSVEVRLARSQEP